MQIHTRIVHIFIVKVKTFFSGPRPVTKAPKMNIPENFAWNPTKISPNYNYSR